MPTNGKLEWLFIYNQQILIYGKLLWMVPTHLLMQNANETIVGRPMSEWDKNDERLSAINPKAMSILYCCLNYKELKEYYLVKMLRKLGIS